MNQQFDQFQKLGKDNVDAAMKAFGAVSQGVQAISVEAADYAKKSFEHSTATIEKLVGVKTLDKAVEIQIEYVKGAYETFVAQATKMGELFANVAKEAAKPYEAFVKVPVAK
jgi:hypothetical protein